MRLVFRVDASINIGTGHVARCLTLANAFPQAEVAFLCRRTSGNMIAFIRAQGFSVLELPAMQLKDETTAIESVLSDDLQQTEARECLNLLVEDDYSLLIVDHYRLSAAFSQMMRNKFHKVMIIDDLANRIHDADILLDQNLLPAYQSRYQQLINEQTLTLLGPQYALLREEFYLLPPYIHDVPRQGHPAPKLSILVFFGGSDADNVTRKALQGICLLAAKGVLTWFEVDVVLGGSNPWKERLYREFDDCAFLNWHVQCDYVAKLMAKATLALGAGGSTHWERCIMGLASLVVTVADNQVESTQYLASKGVCVWLGDARNVSSVDIAMAIESVLLTPETLIEMGRNASQIVGRDCGVPRVLRAIESQLSF